MIKSASFSSLAFTTFKCGRKRNFIFKKLDRCLSSVESDEMPRPWDEYFKVWLKRYKDLIGISKMAEMHQNVLQIQAKFRDIQEERRKVQNDIFIGRNKLSEIQTKLGKVSRTDAAFMSILKEENELIIAQEQLQNELGECDKIEREGLTELTLAICNSQDYEKTYHEERKYVSLITGIIGGVIGVIISSVHWWNRKDIKSITSDISEILSLINEQNGQPESSMDDDALHNLIKLSETVNGLLSPKNECIFENLKNKINEFLAIVQAQDNAFNDVAMNVQSFITNGRTTFTNQEEFYADIFMKKIMREVEVHVEKKFRLQLYISGLLTTLIVLSPVLFYVINK